MVEAVKPGRPGTRRRAGSGVLTVRFGVEWTTRPSGFSSQARSGSRFPGAVPAEDGAR